jgi:hypothetical protein
MPHALFLDIYCHPCAEAGEEYRLARFWRDEDGAVGAEPYSDKGPWRKPYGLGPNRTGGSRRTTSGPMAVPPGTCRARRVTSSRFSTSASSVRSRRFRRGRTPCASPFDARVRLCF